MKNKIKFISAGQRAGSRADRTARRRWRPEGRRYVGQKLLFEFFAGGGLFLVLEFEDVGARVGGAEKPVGEEIAASHVDVT